MSSSTATHPAARGDEAEARGLGWIAILRLGLVQTALGAIVVLTTSTLNRVMVVELALPAMLPGALVGLHYAIQALRPRWGYGSDVGGRRTPWIIGGMAMLALGGTLAALATVLMISSTSGGILLAIAAFTLIGIGVGAAGTSLLALLASHVAPRRRAAAATIVWVMMIIGFIVTAGVGGHFLDPFSPQRLVAVAAAIAAIAFVTATLAVAGIERRATRPTPEETQASEAEARQAKPFVEAMREVWAEREARHFTVFVFVSMLAYSAQDLILEPFAGLAFGMTPGQSTQLAGVQNSGVLCGMIMVALLATGVGGRRFGSLKTWTVLGCLGSAGALFALALSGFHAPSWPLHASVAALGFMNGMFAVAAIGSMMELAGKGTARREGTRMGIWGAAQAIAFGSGGFVGALGVDAVRSIAGTPIAAYMTVFAIEGAIFIAAAWLALGIGQQREHDTSRTSDLMSLGEGMMPLREGKG
jgi:BCD family chlorophyll transporter-like MFS transporter